MDLSLFKDFLAPHSSFGPPAPQYFEVDFGKAGSQGVGIARGLWLSDSQLQNGESEKHGVISCHRTVDFGSNGMPGFFFFFSTAMWASDLMFVSSLLKSWKALGYPAAYHKSRQDCLGSLPLVH